MKYLVAVMIFLVILLNGAGLAWAEGIDYTVNIAEVEDNTLKTALEEKSLLIRLADKKPETSAALQRRIKNDLKAFKDALKEYGYYGSNVHQMLAEQDGKTIINITVEQGPIYTIQDFKLHWLKNQKPEIKALSDLELPLGEPALPNIILDKEQKVLNILMQNGFPFPQSNDRKLFVDHKNKNISVELFLDPGARASFGTTEVSGLKRLEKPFVERRIKWKEGEDFNIEKVARTRRLLTRSGVISSADVDYGEIDENGKIPATLKIKESKHRSVGAGAAYSTTRELVGSVFWEHRNLFGQAEKLRVKAEGGTATYALAADLSKPDMFGNIDLSWKNSVEFRQEFLEAFDKDTAALSTSLNYQYSPTSAVSGGVTVEHSKIQEQGQDDENFTLASFPLTYRYDDTDDFLNPRQGVRFNAGVTPYQILNQQNSFIKMEVTISHYFPIKDRFVWANRARAGILQGQSLEDIPADKRLYAGGGGSVRGYGYQLLGPLDEDNTPTGGRMAFEIGSEGRLKITDTIEGVAFIEGGRVTEDLEFNSNEKVLWGAGSGARYYTPIGPLRVDIAVPLDKREPDDAFQFYISLGQAF